MRRLWNWFWSPAARWSLGGLLILGFVALGAYVYLTRRR